MSTKEAPFESIDPAALDTVAGGVARVASTGSRSGSNNQLTAMLTSLGNSIKGLASGNKSGGGDFSQMMMMMMMGGGGGGGAVAAPTPAPQPPVYVDVSAAGGK